MRAYIRIFLSFFKIGFFTLGGGYAMLPFIEREVVVRRAWIGGGDFLDALALAQSLPGPVAVNTAVFVGYRIRGLRGSLAAMLGSVMPSFIVMILAAAFFAGIKDNPRAAAAFAGLRPAVAALVAASAWSLAKRARLDRLKAGIALAAALAVWLGGVSPAWIVVSLALAGALRPRRAAIGREEDLQDG